MLYQICQATRLVIKPNGCYPLIMKDGNSMKTNRYIAVIIVLAGVFLSTEINQSSAVPDFNLTRIGKASWYSIADPGINKRTANNEIFDDNDMACAIWGVEFNRKIKVTNLANGKSVIVRVNDRGPHERFVRKGRIIDLTLEAFKKVSPSKDGIIDVEIEFL